MRKLFLVFIIAACSPVLCGQASSTPATRDDILKLLSVMNTQEQVRQTMEQVMAQSQAMARRELKRRHPELTEEQLANMDKESAEIARNYPVDQIIEDMIPVYQRHLTKTDVDAMIAFYSSPTGQKILKDMPSIMAEGLEAVYPRLQKNMDDILERMDEKASEQEKTQPKKN